MDISDRIAALEQELRQAKLARRLASQQPRNEPGGVLYFTVGIAIRQARQAIEMTQGELAKRAGLARTSIVNIEGGKQRVPLATLYDIADVLGVQAVTLLPRNEDV